MHLMHTPNAVLDLDTGVAASADSRDDIRITHQLVEAGTLMGVQVHDHLIIAENGYTSLAERGLLGS